MSGAVRITRLDLSAADLRRLSKKQKNPLVVRRMLAMALVAAESGSEKDIKIARALFLQLKPGDRRAALTMMDD